MGEAAFNQLKSRSGSSVRTTCIWRVEITRTSFLLEEEMAFPQTGATLAFTINTFGTSAGRVSRCLSVCRFVMSSVVHCEGGGMKV